MEQGVRTDERDNIIHCKICKWGFANLKKVLRIICYDVTICFILRAHRNLKFCHNQIIRNKTDTLKTK